MRRLIQRLMWKLPGVVIVSKPKNVEIILHYMHRFDSLQADGEWKAHQVYAKLINRLPHVPKSEIRLHMELVYQRYFKHQQGYFTHKPNE